MKKPYTIFMEYDLLGFSRMRQICPRISAKIEAVGNENKLFQLPAI
jgi:hypothetical protein